METQPQPPAPERPQHGPLLMLGLPVALEVAGIYVLVAVQTPLTPMVQRLRTSTLGLIVIAGMALSFVFIGMLCAMSWTERRFRKWHREHPPGGVR